MAPRDLEMDERQIKHDTKKVVRKLLKLVEKHDTISRQEVELLNRKVIECVHKNTGIELSHIQKQMGKVLQDLPQEYGQLDEESRSWEAFITYLYLKYLKELGILK